MADPADVTLAIVNYNGRPHLDTLLASIERQTAQGFTVRVIDDASTDDSVAHLRARWPAVEVVTSERNRQITAALARAVETTHTPYVALLNNDVELAPDWLERLLAALAADERLAGVEGKTLRFDDRGVIDGAGDAIARNGYPRRRGHGEPDDGRWDEPAEIFNASCTAALFRTAAFADVGSFDTDLVAYHEDTDWGYRARLRGWGFRYVPDAVAHHVGSATTMTQLSRYTHLIIRNEILLTVKNLPLALALRWLPRIAAFQLRWLPRTVAHGIGREHLRALAGVLRLLPRTLRKRRAVQRARTVPIRELARLFD
jgi:GT2 family glycosyltransferase